MANTITPTPPGGCPSFGNNQFDDNFGCNEGVMTSAPVCHANLDSARFWILYRYAHSVTPPGGVPYPPLRDLRWLMTTRSVCIGQLKGVPEGKGGPLGRGFLKGFLKGKNAFGGVFLDPPGGWVQPPGRGARFAGLAPQAQA